MRWMLVVLAGLTACDGCGAGEANNGYDDPPDWAPTTKAPPENCDGCPETPIAELGGHGAEVVFLQDTEVDDELAQWANCLHSFMDCVDDGETEDPCMRAAPCPSKCKDAYFDKVSSLGADDYDGRADALEDVFMKAGGVCVVDNVNLAGGDEERP